MLTKEQIIQDIAEMEKDYQTSLEKYVENVGEPLTDEAAIHRYKIIYLPEQIGTLKRVLIGVPYSNTLANDRKNT